MLAAAVHVVMSRDCGSFSGLEIGAQVDGSSHQWYGPMYAGPFWGPPDSHTCIVSSVLRAILLSLYSPSRYKAVPATPPIGTAGTTVRAFRR